MAFYLVWNKRRTECVGFDCKEKAEQAAGIKPLSNPCSSLALEWRELYADDNPRVKFKIQEIENQ